MSRSTLKTSAINAEIRKAQVAAAAPAAPAGKKATAKDKPAAAAPKGAGEIRIIGGAWKRTRLPVAFLPAGAAGAAAAAWALRISALMALVLRVERLMACPPPPR